MSNVVFIGTVESIEPASLSRWNLSSASALATFNRLYAEVEQHPPAATLRQLKEAYVRAFPDTAHEVRQRLEAAGTTREVVSLFNSAEDRGMQVRFKVRALFKHEDDDGDDKPSRDGKESVKEADDRKLGAQPEKSGEKTSADGDDGQEKYLEVSTPFGDCGYDFQLGETYLVYAGNDEGSDALFTDRCRRTRRVTDAGEDLAYVFFYKEQRKVSARLEGFATTDRHNQLDFGHLPDSVKSPATAIMVELKSSSLRRIAQTDQMGRFVFDGLPAGDYQVSAFTGQYPADQRSLAGPYQVTLKESACARQLLLLPPLTEAGSVR